MSKGKVIIIGSGLGGLSTAVILAKNDYDVLVVEQGVQLGGCMQCFTRGGVKFETGMHFVGSASKGQTVDKLLRYLELSSVRLSPLCADGYDVVALRGKRYKFATGRAAFLQQMTEYFPHQRANLERYYSLVERVANASSLHSLRYADSEVMVSTEYQLRSINDVLDEVISDPLLAQVLVGTLPLYAAERDKTPFSTHAFIMDFYNQSAYRFVGGSDTMVSALVGTLTRYGGQVRTRSKVAQIVCDDRQAIAVRLSSGEVLPCDYVVSGTHPLRTLEMLDTPLLRPAFRQRVRAIPQTIGGFSVYLRFKANTVPYMNYNFYGYSGDTPWDCEQYDEASWPKGYLYMHLCHTPAPQYAQSGVLLSYMRYDDVLPWADTTVGHRGAAYEEFKQHKAEQLLALLERDFPQIKGNIAAYYTSSPLTYRDYVGAERGGMYGVAKDVHTVANRVSQRTRIPNVFQTGQNINSHGMLGVLVGTIVTCSEFIPAKVLYAQIVAANS